jgi:hypothetical protein
VNSTESVTSLDIDVNGSHSLQSVHSQCRRCLLTSFSGSASLTSVLLTDYVYWIREYVLCRGSGMLLFHSVDLSYVHSVPVLNILACTSTEVVNILLHHSVSLYYVRD